MVAREWFLLGKLRRWEMRWVGSLSLSRCYSLFRNNSDDDDVFEKM